MGFNMDDLLNKANNQYGSETKKKDVTSKNSVTQKETVTEFDLEQKIEEIKRKKLPQALKDTAISEVQQQIRLLKEQKKKQKNKQVKENQELLDAIETIIEKKLEGFLKDKIIITEQTIDKAEIGIVIDGMLFKGQMKRVK
jgi:hypothetical protein